jgi:hypothetical protein
MLNDSRFRFFQTTLKKDEKKVATLFIIEGVVTLLLLANVLYLNFHLLQKLESAQSNTATSPAILSPTTSPVSENIPTPQPTIQSSLITNEQASTKEYFIPIGSGTTQASEWTDVPGAQATVDFGSYKNIKSIVFETSVAVPTANQSVSVRLYNVSDKHPVWYSEVTMEGGTSAYLISSPIAYDKGSKIYQVQMKTQLEYPANLTQARIHITLH